MPYTVCSREGFRQPKSEGKLSLLPLLSLGHLKTSAVYTEVDGLKQPPPPYF